MNYTVRGMLNSQLSALGADGLVNPECGCALDDLAPCDHLNLDCVAAKWVPKSEADPEIMALQDDDADGYFEALQESKA